jgi:hypothetical protein
VREKVIDIRGKKMREKERQTARYRQRKDRLLFTLWRKIENERKIKRKRAESGTEIKRDKERKRQ